MTSGLTLTLLQGSVPRLNVFQLALLLFLFPVRGGEGPSELLQAAKNFTDAMSMVVLEYSDAFATLGSGVESARKNFDSAEQYNRERAARLGVEWNK